MTIFRKIEQLQLVWRSQLAGGLSDEERVLVARKLEVLEKMMDYIRTGDYLKQQRSKQKIAALLDSGFSYEKVARTFKTSKNSLMVSANYAARKLEERIGTALLMLEAGDVEDAERAFQSATGGTHPRDLLLKGISELMPEPKSNPWTTWSNMREELRVLKIFSTVGAATILRTLDQDRLAHLLYVLFKEDDKLYVKERLLLLSYLEGERRLDETLGLLSHDEKSNSG